MDSVLDPFKNAYDKGLGYAVADTLSPIAPSSDPERLLKFWKSTNHASAERDIENFISYGHVIPSEEARGWVEVLSTFWEALGEILSIEDQIPGRSSTWTKVYESWKKFSLAVIRGYTNHNFQAWTVPCLYVAGKHLRVFAIKADQHSTVAEDVNTYDEINPDAGQNEKLEDAARTLNKMFQVCLGDRSSLDTSRKWGIYYIINLLFKTYFKLNSIALSKNILKALHAFTGDMPALDQFPKAHQVTFKYYTGVINFLDENYVEAEKHLTEAYTLCYKTHTRNKELILTYLIPCHLLTTHTLPSSTLLSPYPRLQTLFTPLSQHIKSGNLSGFDLALTSGEDEFVKRRIYLTLERGRDIALRNLLRKVFLAGGFEDVVAKSDGGGGDEGEKKAVRKTRVHVDMFGAAIGFAQGRSMDGDEVECLLAGMIYKNLMKGYIARERGIVVLSKGGAFPGTGV